MEKSDNKDSSSVAESTFASPQQLLDDESVDAYFKEVMPVIASAVKASNTLPGGEQYDFYTTYKEFLDVMQVEGDRAIEVLGRLLRQNGIRAPAILGSQSSEIDIDDKFEALIDANDQLTERISNKLDECAGIRKPLETELVVSTTADTKSSAASASWNLRKTEGNKKASPSYRLLAARFVQRPQTQFKDKIDNTDAPFQPKLQHKPNAMIPLRESLIVTHTDIEVEPVAPNPYKYEIDRFEYTEQQLDPAINSALPKPLRESGPFTYIDTTDQLLLLIDDLMNVTEIAVDLEAHSYRSFQGLTCLMQLSTRSRDYIIDSLVLRSELNRLNTIFTDPKIVKVFHGADSDIEWLQRDFSLYIVNLFDTYRASKVLAFSRHSLAHLLMHYCQVDADKQYQLADWRIRPLPQELLDYARGDTHHLLYIYDQMKNSLLKKGNEQKNLLLSVLDNSRLVCAKVYQKPTFTADGYHTLYIRSRKSFNNRQLLALSKLYEWRFRLAQQEDESTGYILPNHILLQICEALPRESGGILACCTPIPPLVRQHLHSIYSLVKEAREEPLSISQTVRTEARIQAKATKSILDSLHDTPSDILPPPVTLPKCDVTIGRVVGKETSAWPFISKSIANKISNRVNQLKESFVSPLTNYSPVKFIDFSSLFHHSLKRPGDPVTPAPSANTTLDDSAVDETNPPPLKRSRESVEGECSLPVENVSQALDDALTKAERKRKKKLNEAAKRAQPLRLRPASNPEKKLISPADFTSYDYSKADYSEFKPPHAPKPANSYRGKNQKSKNWRSDGGKSSTHKK